MSQGRFENLSSWKHFLGITCPENTFVLIFFKKQLWDNKELDKTLISMSNK